ncbi:hypothetical protein FCR2A7T_14580 [Flavobacterium cauense R2A-7]|nr:hypothetical protein FCR2A7T_14580 [Flavobacterium cauense R2A-7]
MGYKNDVVVIRYEFSKGDMIFQFQFKPSLIRIHPKQRIV